MRPLIIDKIKTKAINKIFNFIRRSAHLLETGTPSLFITEHTFNNIVNPIFYFFSYITNNSSPLFISVAMLTKNFAKNRRNLRLFDGFFLFPVR